MVVAIELAVRGALTARRVADRGEHASEEPERRDMRLKERLLSFPGERDHEARPEKRARIKNKNTVCCTPPSTTSACLKGAKTLVCLGTWASQGCLRGSRDGLIVRLPGLRVAAEVAASQRPTRGRPVVLSKRAHARMDVPAGRGSPGYAHDDRDVRPRPPVCARIRPRLRASARARTARLRVVRSRRLRGAGGDDCSHSGSGSRAACDRGG
jgi:hypothetical protein